MPQRVRHQRLVGERNWWSGRDVGATDGRGNLWRVPVFSADGGRTPNKAGAGRMMFSVIRPHVATDGKSYKGELVEYSFTSDIEPGSTFSAAVPTEPHIDDATIFIESGSQHQGEREQFDSATEPRGWTPRV